MQLAASTTVLSLLHFPKRSRLRWELSKGGPSSLRKEGVIRCYLLCMARVKNLALGVALLLGTPFRQTPSLPSRAAKVYLVSRLGILASFAEINEYWSDPLTAFQCIH